MENEKIKHRCCFTGHRPDKIELGEKEKELHRSVGDFLATKEIDKVIWKRCVDLNDRALRKVNICLSGEKGAVPREDGFDITVASEIMAIFCLAEDLNDLTLLLISSL